MTTQSTIVKSQLQPDGTRHVVFQGVSLDNLREKPYGSMTVLSAVTRQGKTGRFYTKAVLMPPAGKRQPLAENRQVEIPIKHDDMLTCKKCGGDGHYMSKRGLVRHGCSNCDGLGSITPSRAALNAYNAKHGIRTLPWCMY